MSDPTPLSHQEIEELLGAYALDALEPEEARLVEDHLRTCVRCTVEVGQYHEVVGLLATSGGEAPAHLWDRIADRLDDAKPPEWEGLAGRLAGPVEPTGPTNLPAPTQPPPDRAEPRRSPPTGVARLDPRRRRRLLSTAVSAVAAAAVVLAIVLGVQVNHLNGRVNALATAASHPAVTTAAAAALDDPTAQRVELKTPAGTGARAVTVTVVLTKSGIGYVMAQDLSNLPDNQTYQLWGSIDGQLISFGLLGSKPTVAAFSYDRYVTVKAFAITAERSGGVVQSDHQPVVEGTVAT